MKQLFRFNKQCAYGLPDSRYSYFAYNKGKNNPYNFVDEEHRNIRHANTDVEYFCIEKDAISFILSDYRDYKISLLFLNLFMLRETYEENN